VLMVGRATASSRRDWMAVVDPMEIRLDAWSERDVEGCSYW